MLWLQAAVLALAVPSGDQPVLLDFYSDACTPCRQMASMIDDLADRGYAIQRINVAQRPDLVRQHRVELLPCFVMISGGREVDRVVGLTSYERLARMFQTADFQAHAGPPRGPSAMPPTMPTPSGESTSLPPIASQPVMTTVPLQPISQRPEISGIRPVSMNVPDGAPSNAGPAMKSAGAPPTDEQLIAASVRLRIEDHPSGFSCGSGTIVDARDGWALVLTCGHILRESRILHDPKNFRDAQGGEGIEVDLFGPGGPRRVAGELVGCNLDRDIGLLKVRTPFPVTVARVAPPGCRIDVGEAVASVGCNNGDSPTVVPTRIRSRDRFLPPPNLQTDGQPVEGRSGGGLFNQRGELIGVCNARDEQENQGLFAALASIHAELDRAGLSAVYQQNGLNGPTTALAASGGPNAMPAALPEQMPAVPLVPVTDPGVRQTSVHSEARGGMSPGSWQASQPQRPLTAEEQAALEEIVRRQAEGSEVICIIRSRSDAGAKSEVLMLDKASPAFVQQLAAMSAARNGVPNGISPQGSAFSSETFPPGAMPHAGSVRGMPQSPTGPEQFATPLERAAAGASPSSALAPPAPGDFWPPQQAQPINGR